MSSTLDWQCLTARDLPWDELEARQQACIAAVRENPRRAFLLLSEPRPTFTGGRSAGEAGLVWDGARRQNEGVDRQTVDRGGQWTYHGPGQLLLYPIVSLPALGWRKRDVVPFLDTVRGGAVRFLNALGVKAETPPNSKEQPYGIYVEGRKLASFGISLHGGICAHGLALYVKPQSHFFAGIVPCGVPSQPIVSLAELGVDIDWPNAAAALADAVKNSFQEHRT